ncbi:hypothetical protein NMG60_11035535 [Bertholletia excelsa]
MLILAFGAAILGVMLLHRLREKRMFNLLLKDKDRDLLSLHLLLQRERDLHKEAKRKTEEMKAKIYSLRTQQMELDSKVLEMQSTISSLKDEQKIMESTLEEKQNEIKLLQEKETEPNKENPQASNLAETLKQKEAEIEDLKRHVYPVKVWSVSTDDPSNPDVNLTRTANLPWRDKQEASGTKEVYGELQKSVRYSHSEILNRATDENLSESAKQDEDSSTRGRDRIEDRVGLSAAGERISQNSQKLETSRREAFGDRRDGSNKVQDIKTKDDPYIHEMKEEGNNVGADHVDAQDEYHDNEAVDGKEQGRAGNGGMENLNSQGGEGEKLEMNSRGGVKLEVPDNLQAGAGEPRMRGKYGNTSNPKRKRGRIEARRRKHRSSRNNENSEGRSIRSMRFYRDAVQSESYKRLGDEELQKLEKERGNQNMGLGTKDESGQGNDKLDVYSNQTVESSETENNNQVKSNGEEGTDSRKDDRGSVVSADDNLLKPQHSNRVENGTGKGGNVDIDQQNEKGQEIEDPQENSEKLKTEADETSGDAGTQKGQELKQPEEQAGGVKPKTEAEGDDRMHQNQELGQPEKHAGGVKQNIEAEEGNGGMKKTPDLEPEEDAGDAKQTIKADDDEEDETSRKKGIANKYEEKEDSEIADNQEPETDFQESRAKLVEDTEHGEDKTDEPEF